MGFFDKIKKVFGSDDDVEYQTTDEANNKDEPTESLKNNNLNEKKEIEHNHSEESFLNGKISDEHTVIRNFKYLDDLIHSGAKEIVLNSDIVLDFDEKSQYLAGIKLDVEDLVIDGNGHTIDAQRLTRIFYCTGKNITIKNITLKNGFAEEDGGAIYKIRGQLTITESTLNNNTAKYDGGAIYNSGELTITESTLNNNTAKYDGGAIRNGGELTITESTLNNNTAQRDGGAIYNIRRELTITESTLNNNTAQRDGGAIYNNEGNFKIFNCGFSNNKSPNNIILNKDYLQIHNDIFKDNQSKFIVLNDSGESNLSIYYGEFSENNVEESVLCNSGKFCSVEKTIFEKNISNNTMNNIINENELTLTNPKIKDKGKSILNQNYILIRNSPPKLENKIYGEGTVETIESRIPQGETFDFGYLDKKIHESKTKEIILNQDITFENYERDFYEGGIELDIDDLIINGNGHIIDGADKSRIFIITGKNITLKNIIFKNGHTHKNYDNPLNNNGGAIKNNHNSNIKIENCEFINNTSEENGGAIHNNKCELTITNSTLTENTAQYGGAIHNNKCELTIKESTLAKNTAQYGGAIHNSEGGLTIKESTLTENTAQEHGGAIHNSEGGLTIKESTLTENTAQEHGGAIHNNKCELTITNSTLNNNTARDGGAIHNNKCELTITNSTLNNNTAQRDGGAIHNNKCELTITESTLTDNTSQGTGLSDGGGAIYNREGELTIKESTLTENTAQEHGGAIDNKEGKLTITSSTLIYNTTTMSGGAISNVEGEITITESTLTENTAMYGGVIYNYGGELTITESTLNNGIYNIHEKSFNTENCKFKNSYP